MKCDGGEAGSKKKKVFFNTTNVAAAFYRAVFLSWGFFFLLFLNHYARNTVISCVSARNLRIFLFFSFSLFHHFFGAVKTKNLPIFFFKLHFYPIFSQVSTRSRLDIKNLK
jgi:hypothetical protein